MSNDSVPHGEVVTTEREQPDTTEWIAALAVENEAQRTAALAEFDALAKEVDAARLLVVLLADLANAPAGAFSEATHGTVPAQAELLAFHLIPGFGRSGSGPITPWHVTRGRQALDALFATGIRGNIHQPPPGPQGSPADELDSLLSHLAIDAAVVRGSAYHEQTRREIEEIQGQFEGEFARYAGIGPRRAVALAYAIITTIEASHNAIVPELRRSAEETAARWQAVRRRRRERLDADERRLLATFRSARDANIFGRVERLAALAPDRHPVSRAEVQLDPPPRPAEWDGFCALIGCDQAARARMAAPIEMRERPLVILPEGRVFLVDISSALDQLWVAFERAAQGADPAWFSGRYAKHKANWLEEQIVACLRRVFPAGRVYRGLSYPDPDRPRATAEVDVAVHWPPFLLLVEAKARQFRLAGQLGDTRLLKNDVRANVEDAFAQARRAARYIGGVEEARFTEIGSGRQLLVRRDNLARIYLTTVSQHTLANLATRLATTRPLGLFRDDEYPWALAIDDLDIITRFCPGPDVLLHYVERRLAIQAQKIDLIGDELDFYGAYLDTRLQPDRLWARDGERFDFVGLLGFQAPFDAVIAQRRGERPAAPEIRLEVPEEIGAILGELRRREASPDVRWIAFSLLGLPDRGLGAIAGMLRDLRGQQIAPGTFRRGTYGEGDWVVSIVATADKSPEALHRQTVWHTALEKYRRKAARGIGFGIVVGDTSQPFETVAWSAGEWAHDEELERLLRDEPLPQLAAGAKRPGRNAPCICGSGRKFKHCCMPRLMAAG